MITRTRFGGGGGGSGTPGANGADGKSVLHGAGAPSGATGSDGDFYIDTTAHAIYGPKTAGAWGGATALVGAAGAAGANGTNGSTVLNGSGAPSGGTGVNGDFYLDTTAHAIYGPKTAGAWGAATSLIGPNGSINLLTDVDTATSAPAPGQSLRWDGSNFVPSTNWEYGTLAARPLPGARLSGTAYFATDDNGGTLYRTDGTQWNKQAPGITEFGGRELGAVTSTSNFSTSSTTYVDATGMSVTFTVGTRPIYVEMSGWVTAPGTTASKVTKVGCIEGSTELAMMQIANTPGLGWSSFTTYIARLTPSAGSHTYKVQVLVTGGTSGGFLASATQPFILAIREG